MSPSSTEIPERVARLEVRVDSMESHLAKIDSNLTSVRRTIEIGVIAVVTFLGFAAASSPAGQHAVRLLISWWAGIPTP